MSLRKLGGLIPGALWGPIASAGLILVLASLAGFAIVSTVATRTASERLQKETRLGNAYQQVRYAAAHEQAVERQYRLDPAPGRLEAHRQAAALLEDWLARIDRMGDIDDRAFVAGLTPLHDEYIAAAERMFAAIDAGDTNAAEVIAVTEVDTAFGTMEFTSDSAAAEQQTAVLRESDRLEQTQRSIFFATPIVGAAGVALVVCFWFLLRSHERREATSRLEQEALRQSEARFRPLVQNSSDMIGIVDDSGMLVYVSPASRHVIGYGEDELSGRDFVDFVPAEDKEALIAFIAALRKEQPDKPRSLEIRLTHKDGAVRFLGIVGTNRVADVNIAGLILNIRDISEHRQLEDQLRYQAFHDSLTKLANRARFTDRLEHALQRTVRRPKPVAVLFIDLDNFKSVNDSLGHSVGDRLLVGAAGRLESCLRPGDTAARFGGDEFAVVLEETTTTEATAVAERILQALRPPFVMDEHEVFIRASIGVAVSAQGQKAADELLRNADVAMYAAKSRGKDRCEVYEQTMYISTVERLALLGDLQHALERDEFFVVYQPTVSLQDGRFVGAEALVRWQHPKRGLILPSQFIPLAEESGAILPLGRWVLNEACLQAVKWQQQYPAGQPFTISVNVSARQLQQAGFVAEVAEVFRETEIDPHNVVLEITESAMMQDARSTATILRALRELGVRIAIDDFGTGYSSLSYLRQFSFDVLKIDKSFVDSAGDEGTENELTRAIIELGKNLHVEIVAEGIERREQLSRLRALECDLGQGFYFARPLDPAEIEKLLRAGKREAA